MFKDELTGETLSIFLSYSAADVEFALRLAVDLKNAGVPLYMDRLDAPSASWNAALEQAGNQCAAILPILSPDYVNTAYCENEMVAFQNAGKLVLPVLLEVLPEGEWQAPDSEEIVDFSQWHDAQVYQTKFQALVTLINAQVQSPDWKPLAPEVQQVLTLVGNLQAPTGILSQLESALTGHDQTASTRPPPVLAQTDDISAISVSVQTSVAENTPGNVPTATISLNHVNSQYPKFVIASPHGGGKTFTLRSLAFDAACQFISAPDSTPLPILIDLADWQSDSELSELILAQWMLGGDPLALMASGDVVLHIDGLSDLKADAANEQIDSLLTWLAGENAPKRVVIACDTADTDLMSALALPVATLAPLDSAGTSTISAQYLNEANAEAFRAALNASANPVAVIAHRQMAGDPFLLRALLLHRRTGAELPSSAGAIMKWMIESLWGNYAAQTNAPDYATVETALSGFAYALTEADNPSSVVQQSALDHIDSFELLTAALDAHLLETQGDRVGFAHPFLQQYFAALALSRLEITRRLSKPLFDAEFQRQPKKWDAAVRMLVGMVDDPNALVLTIASVDPYLALQSVFSSAEVDEATYEAMLQQLLQPNALNVDNRVAAANVLVDFDPAQARDLLLDAARSGAWKVRTAAAHALQRADFTPEQSVVTSTINTASEAQLDSDVAADTSDTTEYVAAVGEQAAPEVSTEQALSVWLHFLQTPQRQLQREAAKALGDLKDTAAVPFLVELMRSPDRALSTEAIAALGAIGDAQTIPQLVAALSHADWRVSKTAAKSLVKMGDSAFNTLREIVDTNSGSRRQRIHAIEVLSQMHRSDANSLVLMSTHSEDVEERYAAVAALQNLDTDAAYNRLVECLEDFDQPDWSMQRICDVAANILENMGSREASKAVKLWRLSQLRNLRIGKILSSGRNQAGRNQADKAASDKTPSEKMATAKTASGKTVKERLMRVLTASPAAAEEAPPVLPPGAGDFDWMARREAATALASEPAETAIPKLLEMVNDDESQVRVAAISALATFKDDERVLPVLLQALRDGEYIVSDAAGSALKSLGICPIPGLIYAVRSPDLNVRAAAIDVVGAIGQQDAIPDLIEALTDLRKTWLSSQRICDIAAEALEKLGTPEAIDAVQKWRKDQKTPLQASVGGVKAESVAENRVVLTDLLEALHTDNWEQRQEAAKMLRDYGKMLRGTTDATIVERIANLLNDDDWGIRYAATESLAWIKDKTPVPKLIERVKDDHWMVRASAIRALSEIGDPRGTESMIVALADERRDVREAAAEALGIMGDKSAVGGLTKALKDTEEFVQLAAVEALGNIKDSAAIIPLRSILDEAEPALRWSVADALRKIAHPDAVPDLVPMLQDTTCPHWEEKRICDVAASALAAIDTPEARTALEAWKQGPPNH